LLVVVNKVRPMKYGLVLGNPVVSLHRLGPQLTSISQQSESDGFSTDTENDDNEDGLPDAISDEGTPSGQQSPNSPALTNNSPIRPHQRVAELTLSVPVLQVRLTASFSLQYANYKFYFPVDCNFHDDTKENETLRE
jgi:hypothetical protein